MSKKVSLKQLRQERQLTQTDVAKQMGVSQESISRIENQLDNSDIAKLVSYAQVLGGELKLIVEFSDGSSVILVNPSELQKPKNMEWELKKAEVISHCYTDARQLRADIASLLLEAPIPTLKRLEKWIKDENKPLRQYIKEHFDYWEKRLGLY